MLILLILSIIFLGLAIKSLFGENLGSRFDPYFFIMLAISGALAFLPIKHLLFERKLGNAAAELIGAEHVSVNCQSTFESLYSLGRAGFVRLSTMVIHMETRTCEDLKDYLKNPAKADARELFALHVLSHEAMHVKGELNEIKTDCMAFQRNHTLAKILGVPEGIANLNAISIHRYRSSRHPYYSRECEPGGPYDENLPGAVWTNSKS